MGNNFNKLHFKWSTYPGTHTLIRRKVYKDSKTKKIDLKKIPGLIKKPPWGMLLGSSMLSFIERARLKYCQKLEEISVRRRNKVSLTHFG